MSNTCPIWGTPATVYPPAEEWVIVDSPRAGGEYRIALGYGIGNQRVQPHVRARLTTWLVDQRRNGEKRPLATHDAIMAAGAAAPMRPSSKMERFFLALAAVNFDLLDSFPLAGQIDDDSRKWARLFGVWTEEENPDGGLAIRRLLEERGWISHLGQTGRYRLTADGVSQFEKVTQGGVNGDQCFVAMWFDNELRPIYDNGIEPAIRAAGLTPMRIDRKEHNNKIDQEIIDEIRRSRILVVDVTCQIAKVGGRKVGIARGGVYYEAGYAHGLGIPVIWTARDGMADHLHFDTRQYPHIMWKDAADLREKLKARIDAVMRPDAHAV